MLIVRRERPRRRVLRTDGHAAGQDGPAAVRERRHRYGVIAEVRQPAEHLIAVGRELVIDAHVPLILIVDFVGRPAVVVRGARRWSAADSAASSASATGSMRASSESCCPETADAYCPPSSPDRRCSGGRHPERSRERAARSRSPCGRCSVAGPDSRRRRTSGPSTSGPPSMPPN